MPQFIYLQHDRAGVNWTVRPLPVESKEDWKNDIAGAVVECAALGVIPDVEFPDDATYLQKKVPPMSKVVLPFSVWRTFQLKLK